MRKTWFSYLSVSLYILGVLYICSYGMFEGPRYMFFTKALSILVALSSIYCIMRMCAKNQLNFKIGIFLQQRKGVEIAFVIMVLALSLAVRIWFVCTVPMEPQSDYQRYFDIARLLNRGELLEKGKSHCEYVSKFPHVIGYSAILSVVFRIFGEGVFIAQLFNIMLAVATSLIVWRTVRMLAGKTTALIALMLVAFWPSMIVYNNILGAEYVFSFFFYLCAYLTLCFLYHDKWLSRHWKGSMILHTLLGALMGYTSSIRPMGIILLIASCICLCSSHLSDRESAYQEISQVARIVKKGWMRAFMVLLGYVLASAFVSHTVSTVVQREIAGGKASMGYSVLVGLNEESKGMWNPSDSAYFDEAFRVTGSAEQASKACMELAIQRLKTDPRRIIDLMMYKFENLWGNDNYGIIWNRAFLSEQGTLTPELNRMLVCVGYINNLLYYVTLLISCSAALYIIKKDDNWAYLFVLLFCGTAGLHLFVEVQNRYHFYMLHSFVILAAIGIHNIYTNNMSKIYDKRTVNKVY